MKSKKVLTILLALAIMVTFMPTMAFANVQPTDTRQQVTGVWSEDGTYVTAQGHKYPSRRSFDELTGKIIAELDDSAYDSASLADVPVVQDGYYYDLSGATLKLADIYTQASFENLFHSYSSTDLKNPKFTIKAPAYAYNYASTLKADDITLVGWTVKVARPASYVEDSETDQTVTLTAVIESDGAANGTEQHPYRVDSTTITKTVTVLGEKPAVGNVKFYKDDFTGNAIATASEGQFYNGEVSFTYDGAPHSVVNKSVNGYTVTYATLNAATGKYEGEYAECPTVTNVGDEKKVKATVSWTTTVPNGNMTTTTTYTGFATFTLSVEGVSTGRNSKMPSFGFDGNGDVTEKSTTTNNVPSVGGGTASYIYSVAEGEQYDATQWIDPAYTTTTEKAVKANDAALMDFFKDFYTIKVTKKSAYPDYEFLTLQKKEDKEFDKATFDALKTKHATLLKNFLGYTDNDIRRLEYSSFKSKVADLTNSTKEGAVYFVKAAPTPVVANDQDDDINFSGVTKYVYSGKKAIKKGKLKKNQTIAVKAVADSGNEVTFSATTSDKKITVNSTTGKITVKKGLKKGTYKVQVTAKTAAGNGYKAAKATATYTIVVKKK